MTTKQGTAIEPWMEELWEWADECYVDKDTIPDSAKELLSLTHLNICNRGLTKLPAAIGKLYNLKSFGALAKNGSFGFAKGRLVCRAKPNVPFVRWQ